MSIIEKAAGKLDQNEKDVQASALQDIIERAAVKIEKKDLAAGSTGFLSMTPHHNRIGPYLTSPDCAKWAGSHLMKKKLK